MSSRRETRSSSRRVSKKKSKKKSRKKRSRKNPILAPTSGPIDYRRGPRLEIAEAAAEKVGWSAGGVNHIDTDILQTASEICTGYEFGPDASISLAGSVPDAMRSAAAGAATGFVRQVAGVLPEILYDSNFPEAEAAALAVSGVVARGYDSVGSLAADGLRPGTIMVLANGVRPDAAEVLQAVADAGSGSPIVVVFGFYGQADGPPAPNSDLVEAVAEIQGTPAAGLVFVGVALGVRGWPAAGLLLPATVASVYPPGVPMAPPSAAAVAGLVSVLSEGGKASRSTHGPYHLSVLAQALGRVDAYETDTELSDIRAGSPLSIHTVRHLADGVAEALETRGIHVGVAGKRTLILFPPEIRGAKKSAAVKAVEVATEFAAVVGASLT